MWEVGGTDVQDLAAFTSTRAFANHAGRFLWSGFDQGAFRRGAGKELARYLNAIVERTDEPLRVVAHSHGCNVVKAARATWRGRTSRSSLHDLRAAAGAQGPGSRRSPLRQAPRCQLPAGVSHS